MKEIKLTKNNLLSVIQEASEVLDKGGTIVYPTETSYGLGGDFYDDKAIKKIYKIKQRDLKKPLPIVVPDLVSASTLVHFSKISLELAMKYWPGPLTLVLPYRYCKMQVCFDDFLALRVSSHPFVQALLANFAKPIISTSANISEQASCFTAQDIRRNFAGQKYQPDLFINAGSLPIVQASTIIKVDKDNQAVVLRQGKLKPKLK